MEEIISAIIDLEYKAQDIIKQAEEEKEREEKRFEEKLNDLHQTIQKDTDKKIRILREKELEEADKINEEELKSCEDKIQAMRAQVEANKEVWIKELVDKTLAI